MNKPVQWSRGSDTLLQQVLFYEEDGTEMEPIEHINGGIATHILEEAIKLGRTLVSDERGVYGFVNKEGIRIEFWDCEEESYSEYEAEMWHITNQM